MEVKGLRVNASKTKVMQCRVSRFRRILKSTRVVSVGPPSFCCTKTPYHTSSQEASVSPDRSCGTLCPMTL